MVAGDKESDDDGNEGGRQATATRAKVVVHLALAFFIVVFLFVTPLRQYQ